VNPGVLGVVGAVGLPEHLGGVGAEDVLQGFQGLGPQLVAVADEQGPLELAGVGDAFEQADGDEGLARAGGQRQQGAFGLAPELAAGDLLEHRTNGGVLVIAPRGLAPGVGLEQGTGGGGIQAEPEGLFVAGAQLGRRREFRPGGSASFLASIRATATGCVSGLTLMRRV
jgi:hypothetical protein